LNLRAKVQQQLLEKIANLDESVYIQFDEPDFVKNPSDKLLSLLQPTYGELTAVSQRLKIIVTTYFEHSLEAVKISSAVPVWGIGLDFVHGIRNLEGLEFMGARNLIAGVVDGRNIWLNDISSTLRLLNRINKIIPKDRIIISTSCSLLHTPYSIKNEKESSIKEYLSFACEKVGEVAFLANVFFSDSVSDTEQSLIKKNEQPQGKPCGIDQAFRCLFGVTCLSITTNIPIVHNAKVWLIILL
jgi:5-methyltetrahydropteroyltriglutamate--homocysteine methyltransferase